MLLGYDSSGHAMDSIVNESMSEAELETKDGDGDIDKKPLKTIPEGDIKTDKDVIANPQTEEKSIVEESKEEVTKL